MPIFRKIYQALSSVPRTKVTFNITPSELTNLQKLSKN